MPESIRRLLAAVGFRPGRPHLFTHLPARRPAPARDRPRGRAVSGTASTPAGIDAVPRTTSAAPFRAPAPRSPYSAPEATYFVDNAPLVRPYVVLHEMRERCQVRITDTCGIDVDGCGHAGPV